MKTAVKMAKKKAGKHYTMLAGLWPLRTIITHLVFGISYFVRLDAFRDMPHFVRRDIFAFAKGVLRSWRSGILFAHTTAAGNSTRRSRISLHRNRTRVRRIKMKKHLHSQVLFLVGEDGFEPSKPKQQIYSLSPLTTRELSPIWRISRSGNQR